MALETAESLDGYRELCYKSEINRKAREKCSYTIWNDQSLAKKVKDEIDVDKKKTDDPLFDGVDVVVLHPTAEGGMPHTRSPSLICIPAYYSEVKLKQMLQHEMIHISQRKQPSLWKTRAEMDGWKQVPWSVIPEQWLNRCRLNPDTVAARFFAWEGRHVPLPLFIREDKPDLRETTVRWYDIAEGIVKSSVPTSFTKKYGDLGKSLLEHPYELYAYKAEH